MKRRARRAFTLLHLLIMLPLFAAMIAVGFELVIGSARLQGRTLQSLENDAAMRDLVRRVQQDAAVAREAQIEPLESGMRLVLAGGDGRVVYEAVGSRVRRIGSTGEGHSQAFGWTLRGVTPSFAIEKVGASPGVVWIAWDVTAERQVGPHQVRHLAAAVAVGRGGR